MPSKSLNYSLLGFLLCCLIGCQDKTIVLAEYKSYTSGWPQSQAAEFEFQAPDTINDYDLFIMIRNTPDYNFRNLFLISEINFPNGKVLVDTLEYEMAYPNGELMGQGSSLKTNKLWLKEAVKFDEDGNYHIKLKQAMRKFGDIEGLDRLKGITDVGLHIEKHNTHGN
jgi:gliding motility-associated lipoprotein GldH